MATQQTILVTGTTGQVGFELVRSMQAIGAVTAPVRSGLDLSSAASIRECIRSVRPTIIVNPAAYTAVDKAEQERELAMAINRDAVAVMAEEAQRIGAVIVHYSTDYVFDGSKTSAYDEDDATGPKNVYGESKLAGEQALHDIGVPHFVFRTSWVYGSRGANFLLTMRKLAADKPELKIVADQIGAPTWCRTIADATASVLAQGVGAPGFDLHAWVAERSGVYHLTAGGEASWADFAEAIFEESASELPRVPKVERIPTIEFPRPAARPLNSRMSTAKLRRTFGLFLPDWRDAMRLCLQDPAFRG